MTWTSSDESIVKVQQADPKLKQVANRVTLAAQGQTGDADVTATVTNSKGERKSATIHVRAQQADYGDFAIDESGALTGYTGESTNISIPNDVSVIADGAFSGSDIQSVSIPYSVTSIGKEAFKSTHNLGKVRFESGSKLTGIGDRAFFGTQGLAEIELPEGVTSIGSEAFSTSSVQRVVLPDGVTSIPASAFENCIQLSNVTLSDKVETIGANAFDAMLGAQQDQGPQRFRLRGRGPALELDDHWQGGVQRRPPAEREAARKREDGRIGGVRQRLEPEDARAQRGSGVHRQRGVLRDQRGRGRASRFADQPGAPAFSRT